MESCPQCGSFQFAGGMLRSMPNSGFMPGIRRFFSFTLREGVRPESWRFQACLQCGHLWGRIDPGELRRFILSHCTEETRLKWRLMAKPSDQIVDDIA